MNATSPRDKNKTDQDVGTDPKFFEIANKQFNFGWDLACTKDNDLITKNDEREGWYYPNHNSLDLDWTMFDQYGWLWLNPPYKDIAPWAQKCAEESQKGAKIVMLTPASVGSQWFAKWAYPYAYIRMLTGRLTFKGHETPYPKDCMISIFDNFHKGIDLWNWRYVA